MPLPALPDLDELFAYKTSKVVKIKDRCLGFLWYSGILSVAVYFVIDSIIIDQAHFVREPFLTVIETSLKAPGTLTPTSQLPYCKGGPGNYSQVLPCTTGPDIWVRVPSTGNAELFVATRLKDLQNGTVERKSFVQDPERYTVGISFALQAPQLQSKTGDAKYTRSIVELETSLHNQDGKLVPGAIRRISRFDVIELQVLLQAAGIADASSIRYKGAVLLVMINCPMNRDGSISKCKYTVQNVEDAQAKTYVTRSLDLHGPDTEVQERRGVKIVVSATGEMGQFKWSAFMLAVVSALGMVKLIKIFVDFMMANVMPLKQVYTLLKWEESVDFSDYKHGHAHAVAQVNHLKAHAERFHKDRYASHGDKHKSHGKELTVASASAGSALPAMSGGADAQESSAEALQITIGRGSDDSPARGRPQQSADAIASAEPAVLRHVQDMTEVTLARLQEAQETLREELASSADARSAELEQHLREHITSEITQEREKLNSWAQRSLTKQLSSDFSRQQQEMQARVESRLTDIVSKTLAGSHSSLQQILRDEHLGHLEQTKAYLQQLLKDEISRSIAQATGNLHKQVQAEMASSIAELRRQTATDLAAFREQQQHDLQVELSKHQEPWKPLIDEQEAASRGPSVEELTNKLVSWQPESCTLMTSEVTSSSSSLPRAQSPNGISAPDTRQIQESWPAPKTRSLLSTRSQDSAEGSGQVASGQSSERAAPAFSPLPNPPDLPEARLKAELASLKQELARRTQEEQRSFLAMNEDSPSRSGSLHGGDSVTDSLTGCEEDAVTGHPARQMDRAANRDIW
mmetsp:Transcript_15628/g.27966  ORF Transcript_15628/g.27966 Transcript_15628/m.27966 type:complete len:806 (+) Transcript_15628:74-2491(+)